MALEGVEGTWPDAGYDTEWAQISWRFFLILTFLEAPCPSYLITSEVGKQRRQDGQRRTDSQRKKQQNLGTDSLGQLPGRNLRHDVTPEEATENHWFGLLVPVEVVEIAFRTFVDHGHDGHREVHPKGIGNSEAEEQQQGLHMANAEATR